MNMTVIRRCIWLVAMVAAARLLGQPTLAQSTSAAVAPFERGVQAYLAGDDREAEPLFAQAMRADSRDPRPYYFRALCLLRQGRPIEARADMLIGAELEVRASGAYPVGESLRRLPLAERLTLDEFRWLSGDPSTQSEADAGQFARPIATDAPVLRQKISVRLDQLVRPVSLSELVSASTPQPASTAVEAEHSPALDPFADDHSAASQNKIPSGKLMGILGRALLKSTPVESLDALREKMSGLPLPGATGAAPPTATDAGADATSAPTDDDPFAEPSPPPAQQQNDQQGTEVDDADPFG
jgi:hypothetical protein